jgi:hypothetical protein
MNLTEQISAEVGSPPPPSFELDTLIQHALDRRARDRRIVIGLGTMLAAAVVATVVLAPWQTRVGAPAASPGPATSESPIPLPTRSWPVQPPPTGVWPGLNVTLARIGPSLGVPAGTRFGFTDLGGSEKSVEASWGSGDITLAAAAAVSKKIYSCELTINCIEVTGTDGSMTYVGGPVVAPGPPTPTSTIVAPTRISISAAEQFQGQQSYAVTDFVWSYHPDGTFVMISINPTLAPASLTVAQLVAAGQAFSGVN